MRHFTKLLAFLTAVLLIISETCGDQNNNGVADDADPMVKINSGQLKGKVMVSAGGRKYNAFLGIPYAKPPTDELRFKPPKPEEPWSGSRDATKDGNECPQMAFMDKTAYEGDEDCLFLNVFVPQGNKIRNLPVLFFIHGGGFYFGTGNSIVYGAEKHMDLDAILITINYRLGLLGFLSTQDENSPGNYGMLDVVQALRWVQKNIANFNGEPNNVTVFGESAGGATISYLMLSPLAKGLFHAAIAQSGTTQTGWSFQRKPLYWAKKVAERLNCPTDNTAEMVNCFRQKPAEDLVRKANSLQCAEMCPMFLSPVAEGPGGEGFLREDPLSLMKEGRIANKVPFMTGTTPDEGIVFYILMEDAKCFKTKGEKFFEDEFGTEYLPNLAPVEPHMKKVAKIITKEYFDGKDVNNDDVFKTGFSEILSDTMFTVGPDVTLKLLTKAGVPTYAYRYTYQSKLGMVTCGYIGNNAGDAVAHADELSMQFNFGPTSTLGSNIETIQIANNAKMTKILNTLWFNFARTGKPSFDGIHLTEDTNIQWLPYDVENPRYLELNLSPTMKEGTFSNKTNFWTEVIPEETQKYNKKEEL